MSKNAMDHVIGVDDDGSGTTGDVVNNALLDSIQDAVDDAIGQVVQTKSGNYTALSSDDAVICTASLTLTLYAVSGFSGRTLDVINDATVAITIDGNAAETIDGAATYAVPPNTRATLRCDGSKWVTEARPVLVRLLTAASGSTTSTSAENVATVAISGLLATDTLLITGTIRAVTQDVSTIRLYNNTDSVEVAPINDQGGGGNYPAGAQGIFQSNIRQSQASATTVLGMTDLQNASNTRSSIGGAVAFTTNWTGSWTLAFRHSGVTAGGTLQWAWSVYLIRG